MLFGRKIHDPARPQQLTRLGNKHLAGDDITLFARLGIGAHIGREPLLEHQGDPLAHDTDGVDGIHQCFHRSIQQIACCISNHLKYHPSRT